MNTTEIGKHVKFQFTHTHLIMHTRDIYVQQKSPSIFYKKQVHCESVGNYINNFVLINSHILLHKYLISIVNVSRCVFC